MAVITPTFQTPAAGCRIVTWQTMTAADIGAPVRLPYFSDKSVQLGAIGGNVHGGATVVFQGSNDVAADPSNANYASSVWFTLTDPQGNAISRTTTAKIEQVEENPLWVRPVSSGGDGTTDIDVILVCKGGH
jgi:hypothetical protein